jgi:hypothetical protein
MRMTVDGRTVHVRWQDGAVSGPGAAALAAKAAAMEGCEVALAGGYRATTGDHLRDAYSTLALAYLIDRDTDVVNGDVSPPEARRGVLY